MRIHLPSLLACAVILAACDSPSGSSRTPTGITLASGEAQAGIVGAALPDSLAVRVVDAGGRGLAGVEVQFTAADGSASPAAAVTNADGVAFTRWTLGETTGGVELAAHAAALPGVEVRFHASATRIRPSVTTGLAMTCALNSHGRAFCWGLNGSGELGTNGGPSSSSPVPVATELRFWAISSGTQHTCAIAVDRQAWCWGMGSNGQLGHGSSGDRKVPTLVAGGLRFRAIAVSGLHSCGIATTGETWCWGDGRQGQVGNPANPAATLLPRKVDAPAFDSLTAGGYHNCGLTSDGTAYCWGYNVLGQLGNGSTQESVATPVPVAGGLRFSTLRAGLYLTCGTTVGDGRGYCWGSDDYTAVGSSVPAESCPIAQFAHRCSPRPVPVDGAPAYQMLMAGEVHGCGVAVGGQVYCWGLNNFGVLGTGGTFDTPVPLPIGAYPFVDMDLYQLHTCGITIFSAVWCWGKNDYGRLGDGTTTDRWVPTPIAGAKLE